MPETTSDSRPGPRVRKLPAVWRERAEYVRDNAGAEQAAHVWEKAASELEVVLRDSGLEPLSLDEAEAESGYSRAHLRRLLRQGVIQNAGTESHPLILRSQLPRKPGCGTFGPRLSVAGSGVQAARVIDGDR